MPTNSLTPVPDDGRRELPHDVVVITAHPQMEHSRVNRRLMRAARKPRPDGQPSSVIVRDLYSLYPDYLIDVPANPNDSAAFRIKIYRRAPNARR